MKNNTSCSRSSVIPGDKHILVTGGAGYIGSFMVKMLGKLGYIPVTLDNLSNGRKESVLYGKFYRGDIGDTKLVKELIHKYQVKDVFHFAASSSVAESFEQPGHYFSNNVDKSRIFFETCCREGVRHIIHSSSCAVYGIPGKQPVNETQLLNPISPYGESKKQAEAALKEIAGRFRVHYAILRYFNVVGADFDCTLGEFSSKNGRLFKLAAETATGKREIIYICGTDYPTPDGTAVRDYIHVRDLVAAHWDTLQYIKQNNSGLVLNVGYGHGWSVKEIIDTFINESHTRFPVQNQDRRRGDPPILVGDITKLKKILPWKPQFDDMPLIIRGVLQWEKKIAEKAAIDRFTQEGNEYTSSIS